MYFAGKVPALRLIEHTHGGFYLQGDGIGVPVPSIAEADAMASSMMQGQPGPLVTDMRCKPPYENSPGGYAIVFKATQVLDVVPLPQEAPTPPI